MADQEAGPAGELIVSLRDDLNDELFGNELATRGQAVQGVSLIELPDHGLGVRGIGGLQGLQGVFLGFLDVGAQFIVIGGHESASLFC